MKTLSKNYFAYLSSSTWQRKRSVVLKRDNYICQACLVAPATQCHHLTYTHFGNEPLFDLVSVCSSCHASLTKIDHVLKK